MFSIAVHYLAGRAVAQASEDRQVAEWPPHPARLFFALVAAWGAGGRDEGEQRLLEWLEEQGAPALSAPGATAREVVTSYVPLNDARVPGVDSGKPVKPEHLVVLPSWRNQHGRHARTFPSVTLDAPVVHFSWPDASASEPALAPWEKLLARVTYLGHSSSLVSARLANDPPRPSHLPDDRGDGELTLRVPFRGQLGALERALDVRRATGIRGRLPCAFQAYRSNNEPKQAKPPRRGAFGDLVVFRRRHGPRLPLRAVTQVTAALRGAAMKSCREPVPEALSGHGPGGVPSERPHVAFAGLPDVGHRYADGQVLGVAAVLPVSLAADERKRTLAAFAEIDELWMGPAGSWEVGRITTEAVQRALLPATWTRPSTRWATVTPIVLDRFVQDVYGPEAQQSVSASCGHAGLPEPASVAVGPVSVVLGSPPWHEFLPPRRPVVPRRPRVHAVLTFDEEVRGPMLLGARRYRGLGLCRPLPGR